MHKTITTLIASTVLSVLLGSAAQATDLYTPPLHANSGTTSYRCRLCDKGFGTEPTPGSVTLSICSGPGNCVTPAPALDYLCPVVAIASAGRPQAYCKATFSGIAKKTQILTLSLVTPTNETAALVTGY